MDKTTANHKLLDFAPSLKPGRALQSFVDLLPGLPRGHDFWVYLLLIVGL